MNRTCPRKCLTNRQGSRPAVTGKSQQLVIRFILKALAADRITAQENVTALAKRNLQRHSSNSSPRKHQPQHGFCLANWAARCEGSADLVTSGEVGRRAGIGVETAGPGPEVPSPLLQSIAPSALMSFGPFINLTAHGLATAPSPLFPYEGPSTLILCVRTFAFLQGIVHVFIRSLKEAMTPPQKTKNQDCSTSAHSSFSFYG